MATRGGAAALDICLGRCSSTNRRSSPPFVRLMRVSSQDRPVYRSTPAPIEAGRLAYGPPPREEKASTEWGGLFERRDWRPDRAAHGEPWWPHHLFVRVAYTPSMKSLVRRALSSRSKQLVENKGFILIPFQSPTVRRGGYNPQARKLSSARCHRAT